MKLDAPGEPHAMLLAPLGGQTPDAPDWFARAIADRPERSTIAVEGAGIEVLSWGERGLPGLMFLHGMAAHADVWSYIAPFLADRYRVIAFSWSGMGGSDWRDTYPIEIFIDELMTIARETGLFDGPEKPFIVAHSAGTKPAICAAARFGASFAGLILVDSALGAGSAVPTEKPVKPHRVYPTLEAALARFRLSPDQTCGNLFVVDLVARASLKPVAGGWSWRFDPKLPRWVVVSHAWDALAVPQCPIAFIVGANSALIDPEARARLLRQAPAGTPWIVIPDSSHHLMMDQPLAFVAAIDGLIAGWSSKLPSGTVDPPPPATTEPAHRS